MIHFCTFGTLLFVIGPQPLILVKHIWDPIMRCLPTKRLMKLLVVYNYILWAPGNSNLFGGITPPELHQEQSSLVK